MYSPATRIGPSGRRFEEPPLDSFEKSDDVPSCNIIDLTNLTTPITPFCLILKNEHF